MNVEEFRERVKVGKKLFIGNKCLEVKQVVKFRFDNSDFYIKCFLSDGYVFADDDEENIFLLVKEEETYFRQPFPRELEFRGKNFKFLYKAHAKAEKTEGEEIFKKGESETFWDYESEDGSYLSLGILDSSQKRLDFYGKIIKPKNVKIENK